VLSGPVRVGVGVVDVVDVVVVAGTGPDERDG
jgi:hypothetical protein